MGVANPNWEMISWNSEILEILNISGIWKMLNTRIVERWETIRMSIGLLRRISILTVRLMQMLWITWCSYILFGEQKRIVDVGFRGLFHVTSSRELFENYVLGNLGKCIYKSNKPHVPNMKYLNYLLLIDGSELKCYDKAC